MDNGKWGMKGIRSAEFGMWNADGERKDKGGNDSFDPLLRENGNDD